MTTLASVAAILRAQPRGDGSWFVTDCPACGSEGSLSLTTRGAECRYDGCRWTTIDLGVVVARWLAAAGRSRKEIVRVLGRVA